MAVRSQTNAGESVNCEHILDIHCPIANPHASQSLIVLYGLPDGPGVAEPDPYQLGRAAATSPGYGLHDLANLVVSLTHLLMPPRTWHVYKHILYHSKYQGGCAVQRRFSGALQSDSAAGRFVKPARSRLRS